MSETNFLPSGYKSIDQLLRDLRTRPEQYWIKRGEKNALKLFHEMAKRVPAYKDFLKKHKVRPSSIKTIKDFSKLPLIDKDSYLRKYPLEQLCWDGEFASKSWDISATSGSTGEPFYFPRTDEQNGQYALLAELYLRTNFEIHKKTTLYINAFALGVWIGGIFTHEAIKIVANNGDYALTVISPGLNVIEILKIIANLGDKFDQIIIGSYPPFLREIIDSGTENGLKWKNYDLGFIFSAEGFSEDFRKYVLKKAGVKNYFLGSLNHYGTVDQGTLAYETPLSILIRRIATQNKKRFAAAFVKGIGLLPTLTQYNPELFYFEVIDGFLACSSYSGIPLVRYDLKDHGDTRRFSDMIDNLTNAGVDLFAEINKAKIDKTIWRLPFVYLYERKDFAVSLAGAVIYPETIKKALHNKRLTKFVTGKFTMQTKNRKDFSQYLEINVEMRKNVRPSKKILRDMQGIILRYLLKENSEFHSVFHDQRGGNAVPKIVCWSHGHAEYFKGGGKHKWTKK